MAKNDYLARKAIENKAYFEAGLQMGRQQIIDLVSLCLRDPKIVDKDIFGKGRLLKIVKGLGDYIDLYQPAWERTDETDYYRVKLDAALAEAYGEELHDTFNKRYEHCCDYDYVKGKWKK